MADEADQLDPDRSEFFGSILALVSAQRWVLLVAGLGLGYFVLSGNLGAFAGLLMFAGIAAAALFSNPVRTATLGSNTQLAQSNMNMTKERQQAIQELVNSLSTASIFIDGNTIIQFANDSARSIFGELNTGEPLAMRIRQPDFVAALTQASQTGKPVSLEIVDRAPMERWFGIDITHVNLATDERYLLVQFQDLSQQKRTDRMRVDFVANASHELRTPLASMSGFIETLLGPARDDEPARLKFLEIMRDQSVRMSRLIEDLLSLSRIEMKLHLKPTDEVELGLLIQHVTDALKPLADENGVSLELESGADSVTVIGDENELFQVFCNLIENAIKYGSSGGRVDIKLAHPSEASGPMIKVQDFGPGISPEHLPRLTERFYRIDVESSRKKQGTGLGLAIVKHILNRHNASFDVQSEFGEGAVFIVKFPKA